MATAKKNDPDNPNALDDTRENLPPLEGRFPDVFTEFANPDEAGRRLQRRQRELYLAVRHLLRSDFNFDPDGNTTPDAKHFPENFDDTRSRLDTSPQAAIQRQGPFLRGDIVIFYEGGERLQGTVENQTGNEVTVRHRGTTRVLSAAAVEVVPCPGPTTTGGDDETIMFASVHGILLSWNEDDPSQGRREVRAEGVGTGWHCEKVGNEHIWYLIAPGFAQRVTEAVQRYNAHKGLFNEVFRVLRREGEVVDDVTGQPLRFVVRTRQLAEVTGRLITQSVDADSPQIRRQVLLALSQGLRGELEGARSTIDIDLPDLDSGITADIISDNVQATALIYFSAMLEEMKLYAVTDRVVEHFMTGMLPISRNRAGDRLYDWLKRAPDRLTEIERRGIYGRVLGVAQGASTDVLPNREFNDLWRRFASNVSLFGRDNSSTSTKRISHEQVHKSARDLAVNLSLHGYGVAHFAAVEMRGLVDDMRAMLSDVEVLRAYGVNDEWQLVDRVAGLYLGGAANGVRYRTMATSCARSILWLSERTQFLAPAAPAGGIDFLDPAIAGEVERWLAVTGTPDSVVEQLTDPVDLQSQPTLPELGSRNGIAQQVRDTLDQVGAGQLPSIPGV